MRKRSLCALEWPIALILSALIAVLAVAALRPAGISALDSDARFDGDASANAARAVPDRDNAQSSDASANAASTAESPASPVAFIGFGGLSWASISPAVTPNLYQFAQDSAVANLVVKTLGVTTCPNSAWLTLGTGQRTQESVNTKKLPCQASPSPLLTDTAHVHNWEHFTKANTPDVNGYAPAFGSLADALAEHGLSSYAVGSGAALALADGEGLVASSYIPLSYQNGIASNAGEALPSQMPDLTMIDLGSARASGWELGSSKGAAKSRITAAFGVPNLSVTNLESQAAAIDQQFGAVLAQLPENATVIAASLNEPDSRTAQLEFFAMRTADQTSASAALSRSSTRAPTSASSLTPALSNSTRHSALVQNTDIPVTILSALGVDISSSAVTDSFVGSPIATGAPNTAVFSSLTDLNQRAVLTRAAVGPFLIAFGVAALLYGIIAGIIYGIIKYPLRQPRLLAWLGLTISAIPASALITNLIPWWRIAHITSESIAVWEFFALLVVLAEALSFICMKLGIAVTKRGLVSPVQSSSEHSVHTFGFAAAVFLSIVTAMVFIVDAATGSDLHFTSVLGAQQPQDGSRFYGFGNTAHVTVALAFLFLALAAARFYLASGIRYTHLHAIGAIAGLGLIDLFANASSSIGADFGGTIGIVVGFGLLGLLMLHTRVRPWQFGLVFAAGVIVAGGFAIVDWLRPASKRTHVGNFVQSVLDGELGQVLARKLELFAAAGSPLVWALTIFPIIGVMTCAWLAAKTFIPAQLTRALRHGTIAAVALTIISLAINDSGPLLPFLAAAFAIPLWLAASVPLPPPTSSTH